MAIIDKKGRLRGKVGSVIYRVLKNGTEVVQGPSKRKVKQTLGTKESGLEFGLASNSAFFLRQALRGLTLHSDSRMINRLNTTILRCIKGSKAKMRGDRDLHDGDMTQLEGFQFNVDSRVDLMFPVRPVCTLTDDKRIRVHIPAFNERDLKRAVNGYSCSIQLVLQVINFKEGYYESLCRQDFRIQTTAMIEQSFDWAPEVEIPAGCIALVSFALNYSCYSENSDSYISVNTSACSPAEIIGAYSLPADPLLPARTRGSKSKVTSGYVGEQLLKEIRKLRLKDPGYQKILLKKSAEKVEEPDLPQGKVYFKKR